MGYHQSFYQDVVNNKYPPYTTGMFGNNLIFNFFVFVLFYGININKNLFMLLFIIKNKAKLLPLFIILVKTIKNWSCIIFRTHFHP